MTADPWAARLAGVLGDLVPQIGRLAAEVERCWPDHIGREWAARAAYVHGELGRIEALAAELAARWVGDGSGSRAARRDRGRTPGAPQPGGPLLGGTEGTRVDDESGIRIAELPPP